MVYLFAMFRMGILTLNAWRLRKVCAILMKCIFAGPTLKQILEALPWKLLSAEIEVVGFRWGTITIKIADPGFFHRAIPELTLRRLLWNFLGNIIPAPIVVREPLAIEFAMADGAMSATMKFDGLTPVDPDEDGGPVLWRFDSEGFTGGELVGDCQRWVFQPN